MTFNLNEPQLKAVLSVVRRAREQGIHSVEWTIGSCGLPWWNRALNSLMMTLGADQQPFKGTRRVVVSQVLTEALQLMAPDPKCNVCGGDNLQADPAGYYWHAERWDGAPLLCLDCTP
jgi:hypothetical protein